MKNVGSNSILLLYDTHEKDLARDIKDLIEALELDVRMIPLSPGFGLTLQAKEDRYVREADAMIFLVTPGSVRGDASFPSPSVADEMGQAKQRFADTPERVIYLVDKACSIQAVDQRSFIQFTRSDMRSVVEAITNLISELRAAGLFRSKHNVPQKESAVDLTQVHAKTPRHLILACSELSCMPSGAANYNEMMTMLKSRMGLSVQDANFTLRDLGLRRLVVFTGSNPALPIGFFALTPIGWELARLERLRIAQEKKQATSPELARPAAVRRPVHGARKSSRPPFA